MAFSKSMAILGRSPHGERGLKYREHENVKKSVGRSPHGERGLKLSSTMCMATMLWSLPTRGAWIEMPLWLQFAAYLRVAPHTGSVD